uniref:Uncharacterized protein n=1 Tax=Branchiostoma floridae TaxID=7739 RepID=C3ZD35_BRAFL|eukprot:XP_002593535.1 hypothetical protein BRAFLDRAFT_88530 [Branchiostoma floridae]
MESDFVQEKTGHLCKVCRLSVRGHPGPYGRGKCKLERREGSSDEKYFKQQRGSAHVEEKLRSLRRDSKVSDLVRAVWSDSISMDTDETQVRQSSSHNLKKSSGYSRENASTRARSESPAVQFSRHRARNVSTSREAGPARPEKPDIRDLRKSRALVRKVDKALDELLDSDTSRGKQPRSKRYEDRGSVSSLSQSDSTESDFMRKLRRRQRRRGSRGKSCKMKGERVSSKLFISRRRWDSYDSDTSGMSDDSRSRSNKRHRRRAVRDIRAPHPTQDCQYKPRPFGGSTDRTNHNSGDPAHLSQGLGPSRVLSQDDQV